MTGHRGTREMGARAEAEGLGWNHTVTGMCTVLKSLTFIQYSVVNKAFYNTYYGYSGGGKTRVILTQFWTETPPDTNLY